MNSGKTILIDFHCTTSAYARRGVLNAGFINKHGRMRNVLDYGIYADGASMYITFRPDATIEIYYRLQ